MTTTIERVETDPSICASCTEIVSRVLPIKEIKRNTAVAHGLSVLLREAIEEPQQPFRNRQIHQIVSDRERIVAFLVKVFGHVDGRARRGQKQCDVLGSSRRAASPYIIDLFSLPVHLVYRTPRFHAVTIALLGAMIVSRMRTTPPQSADDLSARLVSCEMPMAQRSARTAKLDTQGVPGVWPSALIWFVK
jgi:hypothetical protein